MKTQLEFILDGTGPKQCDFDMTNAQFVFLGSGSVYARQFVEFALSHLSVIACLDNLRRGQKVGGVNVIGDEDLSSLLFHFPKAIGVLCCQSDAAVAHFSTVWKSTGRRLINMFELMRACSYEGGSDYYADFQRIEDIRWIYECYLDRFKDIESQRSLLSVLLFRADLSQSWLEAIRQPYDDMYFFSSALPISTQEVYVDAGSYDGDSLKTFMKRTAGQYVHIHAMEPDPENFILLQNNFGSLARCTLHNCGLWSHDTLSSIQSSGLGSRVGQPTGLPVRLVSLDELALERVTLLKMDIEGAEVQAIQGSKNTIKAQKPKLAIAAYHKFDDIPRIIETIESVRDDYVFSLSHHSPFFRDTVLMAH